MLQDLKTEIRETKEMDVLTVGDFNEDVKTRNIQEFASEMGSHDVLSEVHDVEKNQ